MKVPVCLAILFLNLGLMSGGTALAGSESGSNTPPLSAELQLASVLQAEHEGRMLLALARARSTFEQYDQHVLARLTYGRLMVKSGDATGAVALLQPLAQQAPQDWHVWFWLGSAWLLQGKLVQAAEALDRALALNGEELAVWVQRAVVEQERGYPQHAEHYLQVAAQLAPENLEVLLNAAHVAEQLGKTGEAIALYRRFLSRSISHRSHASLRPRILERLHALSQSQAVAAVTGVSSGDEASAPQPAVDDIDSDDDF